MEPFLLFMIVGVLIFGVLELNGSLKEIVQRLECLQEALEKEEKVVKAVDNPKKEQ